MESAQELSRILTLWKREERENANSPHYGQSPRDLNRRCLPRRDSPYEVSHQHLAPCPPAPRPSPLISHSTDLFSPVSTFSSMVAVPSPQRRHEHRPPPLTIGLPHLHQRGPPSDLHGTWAGKLATVFEPSPLTDRGMRSPRQIRVVNTPLTGTRRVLWHPSQSAPTSPRVGTAHPSPRSVPHKGILTQREPPNSPSQPIRQQTAPKQAAEKAKTPRKTRKNQVEEEESPRKKLPKGLTGGAASTPRVMFGDDGVPRVWVLNTRGKFSLLTVAQARVSGAMNRNSGANYMPSNEAISDGDVGALRVLGLLRQFLFPDKARSSVWRQLWELTAVQVNSAAESAATEAQFKAVLTKFLGVECSGRVATKVGQVFYAFPKADKKLMTLAEFESGIHEYERGTPYERANIFFKLADEDRSGYLSRQELLEAMEEQGSRQCGKMISKVFEVGVSVNEVVHERKGAENKEAMSLKGFVKSVEAVPHLSTYFGLSKYKNAI